MGSTASVTTVDWLLDSDPAIRWQVLRDLTSASVDAITAERARVASEGWGARLLALQGEDGQWDGGALFPAHFTGEQLRKEGQPWTTTEPTLTLLRIFGVDPSNETVQNAVARVRDNCHWEHAHEPFFEGETDTCINGRIISMGVYFGHNIKGLVDRVLDAQLEDGGWNCEAENGSIRSSFDSTINVLEGLLAYEQATGGSKESITARRKGEEYLLERKLFRRKTNGEAAKSSYLQFSFPTRWHYDVLRALDYFRTTGSPPDPRIDEAIQLLQSKKQADGRWLLENTYRGRVHFTLEDGDGQPSKWNTLRTMRVLRWYELAD